MTLIERLREYACGNYKRLFDEAADALEAKDAEIAQLLEMNLAQAKTIKTLQTKVSYYREISEDMEAELDDRIK